MRATAWGLMLVAFGIQPALAKTIWVGREIAATAREIPAPKRLAPGKPTPPPHEHTRDWIYAWPPVTVGVMGARPEDGRNGEVACPANTEGPATAASALAAAAKADGSKC